MATIHVHNGEHNLDCSNINSNVQSLPFRIHADCDANVDDYFNNCSKTTDDGNMTASFRGYPLKGKSINLPEGYVGLVLHESLRPDTEKTERNFFVINKFSEITHWNWDKQPSDNDGLIQALQWIDIAEAVHSPIVEE